MCTRYVSPEEGAIDRAWKIDRRQPWRGPAEIFPGYRGPFIRAVPSSTEPAREFVVGQWNLIPWFAKEAKQRYATCNARSEEVAGKASYKQPWARGQRCIIPALAFFEPCWETGKHVPWRFERADGEPWGLAGLWNTWIDRGTGEVHESYTMLTVNADQHPVMRRMHKPDPKLPADGQDKRSVVPIAREFTDLWLFGTIDEARRLITTPGVDELRAIPLGPTLSEP